MTKAPYPRLALLLPFLCFPARYMALSLALQNQSALTIGQNVQNLVDRLTAVPEVRYKESMMLTCSAAVDHGDRDEHFREYPLSSNIGDFRDIGCVFRYGGLTTTAEESDTLFQVKNEWPLYWDQWEPPNENVYSLETLQAFSWRKAVGYMSAERADRSLKASGRQGPYATVSLAWTRTHPDGAWCFLNVQITDAQGGGQRTYFVDVRTGRVEETQYCSSGTKPNWGIVTTSGGVPTAEHQ